MLNWEIGIDIYTLICIKWITNKNLLYKKINKFLKFKKKNNPPNKQTKNKVRLSGTSLVAQWLRIHLPMRGHRFEPWSGEIPHAGGATKPMRHNY